MSYSPSSYGRSSGADPGKATYTYDDEEPETISHSPQPWNNHRTSSTKAQLLTYFIRQGVPRYLAMSELDKEFECRAPIHRAGEPPGPSAYELSDGSSTSSQTSPNGSEYSSRASTPPPRNRSAPPRETTPSRAKTPSRARSKAKPTSGPLAQDPEARDLLIKELMQDGKFRRRAEKIVEEAYEEEFRSQGQDSRAGQSPRRGRSPSESRSSPPSLKRVWAKELSYEGLGYDHAKELAEKWFEGMQNQSGRRLPQRPRDVLINGLVRGGMSTYKAAAFHFLILDKGFGPARLHSHTYRGRSSPRQSSPLPRQRSPVGRPNGPGRRLPLKYIWIYELIQREGVTFPTAKEHCNQYWLTLCEGEPEIEINGMKPSEILIVGIMRIGFPRSQARQIINDEIALVRAGARAGS